MKPTELPTVSVVVPVYGGAATIEALYSRVNIVLEALVETHEVIFVNDSSPDNAWQIIQRMARCNENVHGINLMRNYGQHNALLSGIRAARYEIIVTLDDDLQHPPEEIPVLLEMLAEGYDVVYGTPEHERHGFWRNLASQVTKLVLKNAMGAKTARSVSAFRVFRTQIRDAFNSYDGPFVSIDVLLTWGTTQFAAIPVPHHKREIGESHYSLGKLIRHALNMMTGFSTLPLQMASLIGFGFTILGFIILLYVIGRFIIEGGSVPGFPFLASTIAIFSGAQLFALGIIGEYLARIHFRIMDKPSYVIRNTLNSDQEEPH